ncbi:MAG: DNA repair protein RecO [Bacteroidales bacterium]
MLQKTRAIVLHALRYGDSSLIVHAFTEAWGRKTFILKGVRKSKKSNRSGMFQPLYLLNLDVAYRDNRDMQWIREASFMHTVPGFNQNVVKSAQALFIGEVLMKTIREEERNPDLFGFLVHSIVHFNTLEKTSPSFHIIFLFKLSRYLGFQPNNNYSDLNIFFNTDSGLFSSHPDSTDLALEKLLGKHWKACFSCDYQSADQEFNNQHTRNIFLDSLLQFYRVHHHSMKELKSLEVLRAIFS